MSSEPNRYALDADVFIAAHRTYYAPEICPGFWECLKLNLAVGHLLVIDRVRNEVTYPPELEGWLREATYGVLVTTAEIDVVDYYMQIIGWVAGESRFRNAAVDEFGRAADGWLAAFAKANNVAVVTNEVFDPHVRRRVPLPNVCRQFTIPYMDTFTMLRKIEARFDWIQ